MAGSVVNDSPPWHLAQDDQSILQKIRDYFGVEVEITGFVGIYISFGFFEEERT